jgi:Putative beta-lactamase-inhibitor-like, PepSY-like
MSKLGLLLLLLLVTARLAVADCPTAATDAAKRKFPDATMTKCVAEGSKFEVKLEKKDHARVEVEVTATGEILAIEEVVPVSALPQAVSKAFATKYPKSTTQKVEKITTPKGTSYEIEFTTANKRREATFAENGTFVEEE